jgi:hypothetical protein
MWEAAIPGLAEGLAKGLTGGSGPSNVAARSDSMFDSSGWAVNFGAGNIETRREQSEAGDFDRWIPYVLAAVGVVVVWRLTRKR